ncbi:MAG: porin family protein [Acidobacteriota bacterium]|jgi:opacity protein-like surface antigen|nr:porin family protein [Acidobacteriota bacterium]
MKKLVLVVVLLLGISSVAMAQDVPVASIFGGYSFYRCNDIASSCDLHGWNAAVDFNVNKNWAVTADFDGHYGWLDQTDAQRIANEWTDVKSHSFLFGPKYTIGSSDKVRPYLHALFGINHVNPDTATVENNFAMAYGGGVDIKVNDRLSIRPAQVDYIGVRRFSEFEANVRYSGGIVLTFGSK